MLSTIRKQTINLKYIPPQRRKQLYAKKIDDHIRLNKEYIKFLEGEQEEFKLQIKNDNEATLNVIKESDIIAEKYILECTAYSNMVNDKLETSILARKNIEHNIATTNDYISKNNKVLQQIEAYIFYTSQYISKNKHLTYVNDQSRINNLNSSINNAIYDKDVYIQSCTEYSKYIQEYQRILTSIDDYIKYCQDELKNINYYKNNCIDFYKNINTQKTHANQKYTKSLQEKIDWNDSLIAILKLDSNTKLL
jgi:hypothetical protein